MVWIKTGCNQICLLKEQFRFLRSLHFGTNCTYVSIYIFYCTYIVTLKLSMYFTLPLQPLLIFYMQTVPRFLTSHPLYSDALGKSNETDAWLVDCLPGCFVTPDCFPKPLPFLIWIIGQETWVLQKPENKAKCIK